MPTSKASRKTPSKSTAPAAAKQSAAVAAEPVAPAPALASAAPMPVAAPKSADQKPKLLREAYTIPKDEYVALEALKQRATALAQPKKKSELLRAGIAALTAMSDTEFLAAIGAVPVIKTGRPGKAK